MTVLHLRAEQTQVTNDRYTGFGRQNDGVDKLALGGEIKIAKKIVMVTLTFFLLGAQCEVAPMRKVRQFFRSCRATTG